ncbi:MAG: response regulator [Desulfosarcina sp.]|nr:response regulator [Desulfobacterales bacterium]
MDTEVKKEILLFVDDEENILDIAREFFEFKGYDVLTARNGREAVGILAAERVDCCFTDINMPEMDGLALAEHIYQTDNTIPVIVMTGYPSLDNSIATLKNGVVDFLIKPVSLEQMELAVRRVLRQRRLFIENVLLHKEVEQKERLEKLNRELVYKVEELNLLNRIIGDFAAIGSTTDVFQRVVDMALEVAHADMARFLVINEHVEHPFEVSRSGNGNRPEGDLSAFGEALVAEVTRDALPLLVAENTNDGKLPENIRSAVFVPMKIRDRVFGVLTAAIYRDNWRFSERDLYYLSYITLNAARSIENLALYENIYQNLFATLYAFVKALEARDLYTQQHSERVARLSILIGKALDCTPEELDVLHFSGHLHDIGKIGIRDDILLKSGGLTDEEYEKIKAHPQIGANIVGQLGLWDREKDIIRYHHEHYDGTGYPSGLKGDQIPFLARILAVADVFDAMASGRSYRGKIDENTVLEMISKRAGTHFDPRVVETLIRLYRDGQIPPPPGVLT